MKKRLIAAAAETIFAHTEELSELDRAIGDGDHGLNMKRGFEAVLADADNLAGKPLGEMLKGAGTHLVMTIGGASGPLYGSLLLAMGKAAADAGGYRRHRADLRRGGGGGAQARQVRRRREDHARGAAAGEPAPQRGRRGGEAPPIWRPSSAPSPIRASNPPDPCGRPRAAPPSSASGPSAISIPARARASFCCMRSAMCWFLERQTEKAGAA